MKTKLSREFVITNIKLNDVEPATSGDIAKRRANYINDELKKYREIFQVGKTIKINTSHGLYNNKI